MSEMDKPSRFTGAAPENLVVGYVRSSAAPSQPSAERQAYLIKEYATRRGLCLTLVFEKGVR